METPRAAASNSASTFALSVLVFAAACSESRHSFWLSKGRTEAQQKNYASARDSFVKATEADTRSAEAWRDLGNVSLLLNEPQRAAVAFERAIQLVPNDYALWHDLALARFRLDDDAGGLVAAEKATVITPKDPRAWALICTTGMGRGGSGWAAAMTACQQVARLDRRNRKCRTLLALAYLELRGKGTLSESPDNLALVDETDMATAQRIEDAGDVKKAIEIINALEG